MDKSILSVGDGQIQPTDVFLQNRRWFLVLGVILIALSLAAMLRPVFTTLAVELFLGWLLTIAGIVTLFHAFRSSDWGGFFWQLAIGVLYLSVGIVLLVYPLPGVLTLTLVLMVLFLAEGILRVAMAWQLRPAANWGWVLASGIASIVLGLLIGVEWPRAAAWMIGLLFGLQLFFSGLAMIMLTVGAAQPE